MNRREFTAAALTDLPRNQPDDVLRAMADRGGVAGIIFWPYLRKVKQPMAIDGSSPIRPGCRFPTSPESPKDAALPMYRAR